MCPAEVSQVVPSGQNIRKQKDYSCTKPLAAKHIKAAAVSDPSEESHL